jgi:hypothetical protein
MAWDLRDPKTGQNVMMQSIGELSTKLRRGEIGPELVGEPLKENIVEQEMAAKDAPEDSKRATLTGGGVSITGFVARTTGGDYDVWDEEGTYLGYFRGHNSGLVLLTIPEEGLDGQSRGVFYKRKAKAAGLRRRRTQKRQPKRRQSKQEQAGKRRVRSRRNRNRQ